MENQIKCVQIIPAEGWYCRIDAVNVAILPVPMWALMSTGEIRGVVDLGGGLEPLRSSPKCTYLRVEQLTPDEKIQFNIL